MNNSTIWADIKCLDESSNLCKKKQLTAHMGSKLMLLWAKFIIGKLINLSNFIVECMLVISTLVDRIRHSSPCNADVWNIAVLIHAYITENTVKKIYYDDVIMTMLASQITSLTVVYSIVYSGVIQRKHQSSASLAFVREIHRGPVNFPHKWPVTRKMFPFDDVIM